MHKSYLWLLIGLCLLWSLDIHTEYSQNIAWINWVVNSSVQFWLENACAILWSGAAPLLSLTRDSSVLPSYQILAPRGWQKGFSAWETRILQAGGSNFAGPHVAQPGDSPAPAWFAFLLSVRRHPLPCLLTNGLKVASCSVLLFVHYKLIKVLHLWLSCK